MPGSAYLFVHNAAGVAEMLILAESLLGAGWRVTFAPSGPPHFVTEASDRIGAAGHAVELLDDKPRPIQRGSPFAVTRQLASATIDYRRMWRRAEHFLDERHPDALVFSTHRPLRGFQVAAIRLAERRSVACLAVPSASFEPIAEVRYLAAIGKLDRAVADRNILTRAIARLRPDLVSDRLPIRVIADYPPLDALAAGLAGVDDSRLEWSSRARHATHLAVASTRTRDLLVASGVPANALDVTGRPAHDLLAATGRPGRARAGGPVILCAVPQLAEHGFTDDERHWRRLRSLFEQLQRVPGARVVASLHPRMDRAIYAAIFEPMGVTVSDRPTPEEVPAADVLVAMGSSVIELALAVGVPVVDLVCWFDHGTFADAVGRVTVTDEGAIGAAVAAVLASSDGEWAANRAVDAERWGLIDGRACDRIVALLDRLVAGATSG